MTGEGRRQEPMLGPPRSAAAFWPAPRPLNYDKPKSVPVRPQGNIPVIVRLLWTEYEELVPAEAIRWSDDRVMVTVKAPGAPENARELLCWVRAADVYRTIPRRSRPGRPAT